MRLDLQTASSFATTLSSATNTTTDVVNTTGYFRIVGSYSMDQNGGGATDVQIFLDDGASTAVIFKQTCPAAITSGAIQGTFDLIVFLSAGKTLKIKGTGAKAIINCSSHQIADLSGNLVNPI